MDRQLTVRMSGELAEALDRAAGRLRRRRAEVVRRALELYLRDDLEGTAGSPRPAELVRDLLGSYESGIPDLGRRHREHLLARIRGDRSLPAR